jgi:hypothetical protein
VPRKLRTYDAETGERLAVVDLRQARPKQNRQSDFYMAFRAESDDITTDERLSNFETRLMWFMLNRMDFGNVLHMTQVRMAKALKVPPSQISRALKKLETLQLVACADQGTYVISGKPGWRSPENEREEAIEMGVERRMRLIRGEG